MLVRPVAVPASSGTFNQAVTHGDQLRLAYDVGPWALQQVAKGSESLEAMSLPGRGYWRTDTPSEFAPTGSYTYNDTPSNKGGIVPGGGLTIDGYSIPAGTVVTQFRDFSAGDFFCSGTTPVLFRGCRWRHANRAPGDLNENTNGAPLFLFYNDAGGLGAADAQYNEVPFKLNASTNSVVHRNYLSYTTTCIQVNANGVRVTENYCHKLTYYYGPGIPPGESTDKHLNGFTCNGGITHIILARNVFLAETPDDAGRTINQTDCISFFNDGSPYNGGGTNADATTGYRIVDNYVGGGVGVTAGGVFYGGEPQDGAVNDMQFIGNKVTTQWGTPTTVMANGPTFGSNGNVWSSNTWADGPNAGQTINV